MNIRIQAVWRTAARRVLSLLVLLFVLLALLPPLAYFVLGREAALQSGLPMLLARAGLEQAVKPVGVHGSLWGPLVIDEIDFVSAGQRVQVQQLELDWQPWALLHRRLVVNRLQARRVSYTATAGGPPVFPKQLGLPPGLPFDELQINSLQVQQLDWRTATGQWQFKQLGLALASADGRWQLQQGRVQSPWGRWQVAGNMQQAAPFALAATVSAELPFALKDGVVSPVPPVSPVPLMPPLSPVPMVPITLQAGGDLRQIHLEGKAVFPTGQADAKPALLQAQLDLTLFERLPVRALKVSASHINPAHWQASYPQADIDLALDLQRTGAEAGESESWQGQLKINNADSGRIDAQRLPLQSITAQVAGTGWRLQLEKLLLELGTGGQFRGRADWDGGAATQFRFALHTDNLNLQGLHSRLKASKIAGDVVLGTRPAVADGVGRDGRDARDGKTYATSPLLEQIGLSATLAQQGLRLDFQAGVVQQVLKVQQAALRLGKGQVTWAGELDFNAPSKFQASGKVQHFDPSRFGEYPVADLNGDIQVQGQLLPQWQVRVQSQLQPSRLMQQALLGRASLQADAEHLHHLDLDWHFGPNSVRAKGDLGGVQDRLTWQVAGADLSAFGWGGTVQAGGVVSGGFAHAQTSIELVAQGIRKVGAVAGTDSLLRAQGQLVLRPALGGKLVLNAERLNPAAWGPYPAANLNARADMVLDRQGGARQAGPQAGPQAGISLHLEPSSLMGLPLGGDVVFRATAEQLQTLEVALLWGKNQLVVKQLAGPEMAFDWLLDLPQLPPQLLVQVPAGLSASPSASTSSSTSSSPSIPAATPAPDFAIRAQGHWQGSLRAHTVQTQLVVFGIKSDIAVAGAWTAGQGWQGSLQRLRSELAGAGGGAGTLLGSLQAPVKMQWEQAARQFSVQAARFEFEGGQVQLDGASWNPQQWRGKGRASGVPLSLLGWLQPAWRPGLGGGLRFGLAFDVISAERLNGSVHLARESGDWRPGPALPLSASPSPSSLSSASALLSQGLGLQTLQADLVVKDDALQLQAALSGKQVGQAQLQFASKLGRRDGRWGLPGSSPLQLQASARLDSIAPLAGLLGAGEQLAIGGKMALKLEGSGSIGAPVFSGNVTGDDLMLRWINEGLVLRNGALRAEWNGPQLQVQDLHFDGVQAQGVVQLAGAQTSMHMTLKAKQLTLLSRPDRLLVVSGQSEVDFDAQGLRLAGKLKADRAQLELLAQDTPILSDDIRLFHGSRLQEKSSQVLPLRVDLDMDLGEQFQVRGQGLDVRLTGKLHWQALEKRGPRLLGEVQVAEGTYRAYGKKLTIERSSINFSGAWDNPGLNIRAFRPRSDSRLDAEMEPEVGVELSGTLLAPQARLVSTPALPDSEKLAYLVLGHGLEGAGGQELGLLSAASTALFGQTNEDFSKKLGLDELGVSYAKGVNNAVLTLGKRLSQRAFLRFEQGVGSASGLVKLRYLFSSRLSVQVQGGSNTAVDAFYSFRFD